MRTAARRLRDVWPMPIRLRQTPTTYRGGQTPHLAPAKRPWRPVPANEAVLESGPYAGEALSATMSGQQPSAPHDPLANLRQNRPFEFSAANEAFEKLQTFQSRRRRSGTASRLRKTDFVV